MNVRAWLDALQAAWLARDPAAISELFSADAVYYQGPLGPPKRGRPEIAEHWTQTLSRQREPRIWFGPPIEGGGQAAVEWWCVLHDPQSGEPRTAAGCVVTRFDEAGRCAELHEYWHGGPGAVTPVFGGLIAAGQAAEAGRA
jgi:hypothetical protein